MAFYGFLSILLWVPLIASPITYLLSKNGPGRAKVFATIVSALEFIYSLVLWYLYVARDKYSDLIAVADGFVFHEKIDWIVVGNLKIYYALGVDGLSLPLVVLTTLIFLVSIISSYYIHEREPLYYSLMLLLMAGVMGTFIALDLFLFYIAWEIVLVPMFFIIAYWGGPRRRYSAFKFFIYTHLASLFMLIGIFIVFKAGNYTFYMPELKTNLANYAELSKLILAFYLMAVGFITKFPQVPVHTWLPDAHVEAPSPGSSVLAGLLLKMGGYGLIRLGVWMLPKQVFTDPSSNVRLVLALLGMVSMAYTAFVALSQKDMKRLIAYSSIGHMGIVSLGIASYTAEGINGAIFMMIAHGVISPTLFLISGVIQHNAGTRDMTILKGLWKKLPITSTLLVFSALASAGLPSLAGFVAEFLTFAGLFKSDMFGYGHTYFWITVVAVMSVIVVAGYYLWMLQRIVFGEPEHIKVEHKPHFYEIFPLWVLSFFILLLGLLPFIVLKITDQFVSIIIPPA